MQGDFIYIYFETSIIWRNAYICIRFEVRNLADTGKLHIGEGQLWNANTLPQWKTQMFHSKYCTTMDKDLPFSGAQLEGINVCLQLMTYLRIFEDRMSWRELNHPGLWMACFNGQFPYCWKVYTTAKLKDSLSIKKLFLPPQSRDDQDGWTPIFQASSEVIQKST